MKRLVAVSLLLACGRNVPELTARRDALIKEITVREAIVEERKRLWHQVEDLDAGMPDAGAMTPVPPTALPSKPPETQFEGAAAKRLRSEIFDLERRTHELERDIRVFSNLEGHRAVLEGRQRRTEYFKALLRGKAPPEQTPSPQN